MILLSYLLLSSSLLSSLLFFIVFPSPSLLSFSSSVPVPHFLFFLHHVHVLIFCLILPTCTFPPSEPCFHLIFHPSYFLMSLSSLLVSFLPMPPLFCFLKLFPLYLQSIPMPPPLSFFTSSMCFLLSYLTYFPFI